MDERYLKSIKGWCEEVRTNTKARSAINSSLQGVGEVRGSVKNPSLPFIGLDAKTLGYYASHPNAHRSTIAESCLRDAGIKINWCTSSDTGFPCSLGPYKLSLEYDDAQEVSERFVRQTGGALASTSPLRQLPRGYCFYSLHTSFAFGKGARESYLGLSILASFNICPILDVSEFFRIYHRPLGAIWCIFVKTRFLREAVAAATPCWRHTWACCL
ncbi:hypothetical protein D9613_012485 [Agrocybe pediades]|uniref:Uncharacterized protein n=1 Tax=Agrocybe pediades TaxID=84607 RepID=A0A8H4QRP5_9AGAR|nr:hypothetical protein D9613_012485 [Agrocybe pediades]